MTTVQHPFEQRGLGLAPFRLVTVYEKRGPIDLGNGHMVGAPGQPMGTCDYCGTGIAICCVIESSDGQRFEVGSDCVRKTYSKGEKVRDEVETTVRQLRATKQREAFMEKVTAARSRCLFDDALRAALDARPHPNHWQAEKGHTRLSWALWMLANAGTEGRKDVLWYIEQIDKKARS